MTPTMFMLYSVIIVVIWARIGYSSWLDSSYNVPGYHKIQDGDREFYCHDCCKHKYPGFNIIGPNNCCMCWRVPCWSFLNVTSVLACGYTHGPLYIEHRRSDGLWSSIVTGETYDKYALIHTNGILSTLPDNMCDFASSLINVNLDGNQLTNISSIRCMYELEWLSMSNNKISYIEPFTFYNMTKLLTLKLVNNKLTTLVPYALWVTGNISIYHVNVPLNDVETVDATNMFRPGNFCEFYIRGTNFTEVINKDNFTLSQNLSYGVGWVVLHNTNAKNIIDMSVVAIRDNRDVGKYDTPNMSFIRIRDAAVPCDCNMYPYLQYLVNWPDFNTSIGDAAINVHCETNNCIF